MTDGSVGAHQCIDGSHRKCDSEQEYQHQRDSWPVAPERDRYADHRDDGYKHRPRQCPLRQSVFDHVQTLE